MSAIAKALNLTVSRVSRWIACFEGSGPGSDEKRTDRTYDTKVEDGGKRQDAAPYSPHATIARPGETGVECYARA